MTETEGLSYRVEVEPTPGFQIIRFPGPAALLPVYLVSQGSILLTLPEGCRLPGQPGCNE